LTKIICNQCGKEISINEPIQCLDLNFEYDSEYDGKVIHIDLHESCADKAFYNMIKEFEVKPELEDYNTLYNGYKEFGFSDQDEY
jgi:hypothetical protein